MQLLLLFLGPLGQVILLVTSHSSTDGSGIVEELGEGVSKVSKGDRVWVSGSVTGTYAQYCLVNEEDTHPLPSCVTFEQG